MPKKDSVSENHIIAALAVNLAYAGLDIEDMLPTIYHIDLHESLKNTYLSPNMHSVSLARTHLQRANLLTSDLTLSSKSRITIEAFLNAMSDFLLANATIQPVFEFVNSTQNVLAGYIIKIDRSLYFGFRGSRHIINDWFSTNLLIHLQAFSKGSVHYGFHSWWLGLEKSFITQLAWMFPANTYTEVLDRIRCEMDSIVFAGHSLGASVAQIGFSKWIQAFTNNVDLQQSLNSKSFLVTFASPLVFDAHAVESLSAHFSPYHVTHYEHPEDLVPSIPDIGLQPLVSARRRYLEDALKRVVTDFKKAHALYTSIERFGSGYSLDRSLVSIHDSTRIILSIVNTLAQGTGFVFQKLDNIRSFFTAKPVDFNPHHFRFASLSPDLSAAANRYHEQVRGATNQIYHILWPQFKGGYRSIMHQYSQFILVFQKAFANFVAASKNPLIQFNMKTLLDELEAIGVTGFFSLPIHVTAAAEESAMTQRCAGVVQRQRAAQEVHQTRLVQDGVPHVLSYEEQKIRASVESIEERSWIEMSLTPISFISASMLFTIHPIGVTTIVFATIFGLNRRE